MIFLFVPDIHITIVDPHRPGHELTYYPGETNFLLADIIVISKEDTAKAVDINLVKEHIKLSNPKAAVVDTTLPIMVEKPELIKGKRVLVVGWTNPDTRRDGLWRWNSCCRKVWGC